MDIKTNNPVDDLAELNRMTEKIIGCGFKVSNSLDGRFLEKVYENALAHELENPDYMPSSTKY